MLSWFEVSIWSYVELTPLCTFSCWNLQCCFLFVTSMFGQNIRWCWLVEVWRKGWYSTHGGNGQLTTGPPIRERAPHGSLVQAEMPDSSSFTPKSSFWPCTQVKRIQYPTHSQIWWKKLNIACRIPWHFSLYSRYKNTRSIILVVLVIPTNVASVTVRQRR